MTLKNFKKDSLFKSIVIAHIILLLHVILLAGIGVTIVLFRGAYLYLPWIMGFIGIFILGTAFIFYQRMKSSSSDIRKILALPEFQHRTIDIKLLGGLASFRIEADKNWISTIDNPVFEPNKQLIQNNIHKTETKILELTALFEKDIITKEDFEKAKMDILHS